jgi:predicted membrane protein
MSGRKIIIGLFLVAFGMLLLSRTMGFWNFTVSELVGLMVPISLIALGLWILARTRSREQAAQAEQDAFPPPDYRVPQPIQPHDSPRRAHAVFAPPLPGTADSGSSAKATIPRDTGASGKTRYNKFIGDMFIDCNGMDLQSLEVGRFLGDVEIKLHGGRLAPGLNRMIVSGFIGDVRILVPEGMAVFAQSSNFIGDIEMMGKRSSGIGNSLDAQTKDYADSPSRLFIASNHFIGDVRVYIV